MESSLNEEIDVDGSLLNQANAGPFNVIVKALHRTVRLEKIPIFKKMVKWSF